MDPSFVYLNRIVSPIEFQDIIDKADILAVIVSFDPSKELKYSVEAEISAPGHHFSSIGRRIDELKTLSENSLRSYIFVQAATRIIEDIQNPKLYSKLSEAQNYEF